MFKIKRRRKEVGEVPMSATSDIAFLLIIFFMLAFILSDDSGVQLNQPNEKDEPKKMPEQLIGNLEIDAYNRLFVDGYLIENFNELENYLLTHYQENPDFFVLLSVHEDSLYGFMVEVFSVLKRYQDLHYSVKVVYNESL